MVVRSSSVSLPHFSFTLPVSCFQFPAIVSQFMSCLLLALDGARQAAPWGGLVCRPRSFKEQPPCQRADEVDGCGEEVTRKGCCPPVQNCSAEAADRVG